MAGTGEGMLAGSEALWFELFLGCVYLVYSLEALAVSYLPVEVAQIALHWKMEGLQLNLLLPGANFCACTGPWVVFKAFKVFNCGFKSNSSKCGCPAGLCTRIVKSKVWFLMDFHFPCVKWKWNHRKNIWAFLLPNPKKPMHFKFNFPQEQDERKERHMLCDVI